MRDMIKNAERDKKKSQNEKEKEWNNHVTTISS